MNRRTVLALNAVNARFYSERAEEFSASRERPWRGWEDLLRRWDPLPNRPSVLDLGCGNGRFARFLTEYMGDGFTYVGVDASPLALAEARRRLGQAVELIRHDFVDSAGYPPRELRGRRFDIVVLFGVLHHVPGRANRLRLMRRVSENVGTRLAFTAWRFMDFERFRKKIVSWEYFLRQEALELEMEQLEPGDHIMTWGNAPPGFRYCHDLTEEESTELVEGLGLTLEERFVPGEEPNQYFVFRRLCQSVTR